MEVASGVVVTLEYTVRLASGTLVDSTSGCGPLSILYGAGQLFPALEDRIAGMRPGETRALRIPAEDAYEIRARGPMVTPGYFGRPDLTAAAFDQDGFYRTGDAAALADPGDPGAGLVFRGRLAEDFKLATGTFVRVGALRGALVSACGGVLSDAAIAGHDEAYAGALGWLNAGEAERVCGGDAERLRAHLADALARMNSGEGSARRIERLLLLDEPPNMDAGEITDKGYVNQRAALERRHAEAAALYAQTPAAGVVEL